MDAAFGRIKVAARLNEAAASEAVRMVGGAAGQSVVVW